MGARLARDDTPGAPRAPRAPAAAPGPARGGAGHGTGPDRSPRWARPGVASAVARAAAARRRSGPRPAGGAGARARLGEYYVPDRQLAAG
jgi:hypothetical protein